MLRALSTRRSTRGYEQLTDESATSLLDAKLKRVASVPAKVFTPSIKLTPEFTIWEKEKEKEKPQAAEVKPSKKVDKIHPLFSLFDGRRRKKKTTAKPEFARYLEYVKEAGMWDSKSNLPVIHYK